MFFLCMLQPYVHKVNCFNSNKTILSDKRKKCNLFVKKKKTQKYVSPEKKLINHFSMNQTNCFFFGTKINPQSPI